MNDDLPNNLLDAIYVWFNRTDKAAYELMHGWGCVEEPWIKLFVDCAKVFEGTESEFRKWVKR